MHSSIWRGRIPSRIAPKEKPNCSSGCQAGQRGDGRLLALLRLARPEAEAVALDFPETMLSRLRTRFAADSLVSVLAHDIDQPLPDSIGRFDAVVSGFAVHHLTHERKRALYEEVYGLLRPGGAFCNLEHVA